MLHKYLLNAFWLAYLLCVNRTFQLSKVRLGVDSPKKDGFVLIHASVGKEKRRIGEGNNRRGRY